MNIEELRDFCLSLKGVSEEMPFDDKVLVFKVMGKIFCLTNIEHFESINVKCDPEKAIELRETYKAVRPGYHMNKKHWNTIQLNDSISVALLEEWIIDSYQLVANSLTKKLKEEMASLLAPILR